MIDVFTLVLNRNLMCLIVKLRSRINWWNCPSFPSSLFVVAVTQNVSAGWNQSYPTADSWKPAHTLTPRWCECVCWWLYLKHKLLCSDATIWKLKRLSTYWKLHHGAYRRISMWAAEPEQSDGRLRPLLHRRGGERLTVSRGRNSPGSPAEGAVCRRLHLSYSLVQRILGKPWRWIKCGKRENQYKTDKIKLINMVTGLCLSKKKTFLFYSINYWHLFQITNKNIIF